MSNTNDTVFLHDQIEKLLDETREHTKEIEQYAKNHATIDDPDEMEKALKERIDKMKRNIDLQLSTLQESVLRRRPTNKEDPKFHTEYSAYIQFLTGATNGIDQFRQALNSFFTRLMDVCKRILKWIREQVKDILPLITDVFKTEISPLLKEHFKTTILPLITQALLSKLQPK
jgi:tRNA A37 N6-isopentenylltransferase MiaA